MTMLDPNVIRSRAKTSQEFPNSFPVFFHGCSSYPLSFSCGVGGILQIFIREKSSLNLVKQIQSFSISHAIKKALQRVLCLCITLVQSFIESVLSVGVMFFAYNCVKQSHILITLQKQISNQVSVTWEKSLQTFQTFGAKTNDYIVWDEQLIPSQHADS